MENRTSVVIAMAGQAKGIAHEQEIPAAERRRRASLAKAQS
jgi:hypothetical protein